MKNIHVLPTENPSRLIFNSFHKSFCYQKEIDGMYINDGKVSGADFWGLQKALNNGFKPQNIYITNDEEIKEGDWFHIPNNFIGFEHISKEFDNSLTSLNAKKIILTTDQDLIADGVQAIDDEFFEWFVKNPSCERVEIVYEPKNFLDTSKGWEYTIISKIPKEEALEEAKQNYLNKCVKEVRQTGYCDEDFEAGAKWQQEDKQFFNDDRVKTLEKSIEYLLNKLEQKYSIDDLKEAFAMGRLGKTIGKFNNKFKKN